MLASILALFGCKKTPAISAETVEFGPFTVDKITTTGKTWDINYGRVDYSNVSYEVKYKGAPLTFDHLETNTALPGIWRVFHLQGASQPTLILGSQSMYLVTEENDQVRIKPLHTQTSDFASIQWLDSEDGQPGEYREIYSSDTYDTEMELSGGRYMAISHSVVLDTRTFELFPFNTDHALVDGYYPQMRNAVGFSPDSTQVVFSGNKQDEADNMKFHMALLCFDFKKDHAYAVPFNQENTYLKNETWITSEWLNDFFEWTTREDHMLKLRAKSFKTPPPRKGVLLRERHKGHTYTLYPAEASMMDHLLGYIKTEFNLDTTRVYRIEGDYINRYYLKIGDTLFNLIYGEYGSDLVLKLDQQSQVTSASMNTVSRIAKGFNTLLESGEYADSWSLIEGPQE